MAEGLGQQRVAPDGYVLSGGSIGEERGVATALVGGERIDAAGGVARVVGVGEEGAVAGGHIAAARRVGLEREGTQGGVVATRGVRAQCLRSHRRVFKSVGGRGRLV